MVDDKQIEETKNAYIDLAKTFSIVAKSIGHTLAYKTLLQDIIILALTHVQINNEISYDKINFLTNFLNLGSAIESYDLLEDFKKNARIKPCPYPLGYCIPTSFKIAVNIDIITGKYNLSKLYYEFIGAFFNIINNSFSDMDYDKIQCSISYVNDLNNYILSSILNNS